MQSLRWLRRVSPQEFRLSIVTLLGVITVGVLPGVVVAVGLALVQLLARASHPHDAELGRLPPLNEPVTIELTPEKTGEIAFACGTNMLRGTIVVE